MPLLIVAMVLAYLITRTVSDAKTDRALAAKGIVSPRLQAKYGDRAKAETARYGLGNFVADAWSDNWRSRTETRRAATQAAKETQPASPGGKVRWWDRLAAAQRAVAKVGRKLVDPVPDRSVEPGPAVPPPKPTRHCPDCGEPLADTGTGWDHPAGPNCAVTGTTYRPPAPRPRPMPGRTPMPVPPEPVHVGPNGLRRCAGCSTNVDWDSTKHYPYCNSCGLRRAAEANTQPPPAAPPQPVTNPQGDKPMTTPTGEAVNYETTVAQLEALIAELRKWLDSVTAALVSLEHAKNLISDGQDAYRTAVTIAEGLLDHLAALHLDGTTLGHLAAIKDALPASAVDTLLALLEEAEEHLKTQRGNAETALSAAEAALAHVIAEYGEEAAKVAQNLGGDPTFLGS